MQRNIPEEWNPHLSRCDSLKKFFLDISILEDGDITLPRNVGIRLRNDAAIV
jgi:hypothetical protein